MWFQAFITKEVVEKIIHIGVVSATSIVVARKYCSAEQWNTVATWIESPATYAALIGLATAARGLFNSMKHSKAIAAVQAQAQTLPPAPAAELLKSAGVKAALLLLILTPFVSNAQTTNTDTNTPTITLPGITVGGTLPTNITTAANDLIPMIKQLLPYITNISGVSMDFDGVLSTSNKIGEIGALNFALPGATNYLSMGIAEEYIGNDWYIAPVNVKLGASYTIPYISVPAYSFVGTGLSIRLKDSATGDQTIIGEAVVINLGNKWYIDVDGGYLLLTQTGSPKQNYFGGFRLGKNF